MTFPGYFITHNYNEKQAIPLAFPDFYFPSEY